MEDLEMTQGDTSCQSVSQPLGNPSAAGPVAPLFSVIIPTYNRADYLKLAIQSVLDQTFSDFEVIVIDNYSSDHTALVLAQLQILDQRVQCVDFRNHGLVAASRNVGIQRARGRYIAFLDSDDVWYPQKLERVADAFSNNRSVRAVCHDEFQECEGKADRLLRYGPRGDRFPSLYEYLLFEKNCLSTSATVVEKVVLEQLGSFSENPEFLYGEDYDLWLRLSRVCQIHFLHEPLGRFRVHSANDAALTERNWQGPLNVFRNHQESLEAGSELVFYSNIARRLSLIWLSAARGNVRKGNLADGLKYLLKAWTTSPLFWKLYPRSVLMVSDWVISWIPRRG